MVAARPALGTRCPAGDCAFIRRRQVRSAQPANPGPQISTLSRDVIDQPGSMGIEGSRKREAPLPRGCRVFHSRGPSPVLSPPYRLLQFGRGLAAAHGQSFLTKSE